MAEPTLFDEASLALIASGGAGKDGKVYSIKPVPEYGAEQITNGGFAADLSGWTINNANAANTVEWSAGQAHLKRTASTATELQQVALVVGKKYYVNVDVSNIGDALGAAAQYNGSTRFIFSQGVNSFEFIANNILFSLICLSNTTEYYIDNVSIKEVVVEDGDFTFSRGSNLAATRVGPDGLIEKGRENLLLQSNQFDTTWVQSSATLTSGQSGYDGSSDAWLLTKNASFGRLDQTISSSGVQTYSVYAKANDSDWIYFRADYSGGVASGYFDLVNGVGGSFGNIIDSDITSVGGGWYRIQIVFNATTTIVRIYPAEDNNQSGGTSGSIYIQDSQLEIGLAATEVISSGASTGKAGLLEDEPRFDYSGGATCPSLLLEPSRTNRVTNSEYLNGAWSELRSTLIVNNDTSPEGVNNATKLQEDTTASNTHFTGKGYNYVSGTTYSWSVYAKADGRDEIAIQQGNPNVISFNAVFNFTSETATNFGNGTARIEDAGNGWYRCIIEGTTALLSSGTNINVFLRSGNSTTYTGDGTSGVLLYGFQLEEGSYATSYIPTYGSSQTRAQENCSNTSIPLLSQTSGTYFLDITPIDTFSNNFIDVRALGSMSNRLLLQAGGANLRVLVRAQNTTILDSNIGNVLLNETKVKIAVRYTPTNISVFIDGIEKINNSVTLDFNPELNWIDLEGTSTSNDNALKHHQFLFFPTALSDTELIKLTTI